MKKQRMKLKQSEGQEKCTFNRLARLRNVSAALLWGDKCWLTKKWNTWLQKMKFCDIEGDIQDVLQWSNPFRMIYSWDILESTLLLLIWMGLKRNVLSKEAEPPSKTLLYRLTAVWGRLVVNACAASESYDMHDSWLIDCWVHRRS